MNTANLRESINIQGFLEELLVNKETSEVEFKSAKGGFPGSFWETYSSFANTNGGIVIFGIKEKHGEFSVEPLTETQVNDFKKKFSDLQHDREKISLPLLTDKDMVAYRYDCGYLLAFFIPRATREQRPVYVGLDPLSGTFRRDHEGDYRCDASTVSQMFADRKNAAVLQDARILPNYSWADIDDQSFKQYRILFSNLTPSHPWVVLDDMELMKKLGGYRKDRASGQEGFTVAGLLMFGKYEAITDVECVPDFMVDYREIPRDTSRTRWVDRLYPDGTWESNLFQFYRRVLPKLFAFVPKPFMLIGDERQEETAAHEALREAFINMCVHGSYGRSPHLVIEKRSDSIILRNPGTLLISVLQYYEGGHSECRNPSLQKMFGLIGRSDKAGSGVDKILKGWRSGKWSRPDVREKSHPDIVELQLPLELYEDKTGSIEQNSSSATASPPLVDRLSTSCPPPFDQLSSISPLVQKLIELGAVDYMTVHELAELYGIGDLRYFRKKYLSPAIADNSIERLYPEQINHPRQKYRLTRQIRDLVNQKNSI